MYSYYRTITIYNIGNMLGLKANLSKIQFYCIMDNYISEITRLMTLTTNRRALRMLAGQLTKAKAKQRSRVRKAVRARLALLKSRRADDRAAVRLQLPKVKWIGLDHLRMEAQMRSNFASGISAQGTPNSLLEDYWWGRTQVPNIDSSV